MADKNISALPAATSLDDGSLLVAEQQGKAVSVSGSLFRDFLRGVGGEEADRAEAAADRAQEVVVGVSEVAAEAEAARDAIEQMIVEAVTLGNGQPATVTKDVVDGVFRLVFGLPRGEQGIQGVPGNSIASIQRTSGTGASGSTDTYTVTLTDGSTTSFQVYNGRDGSGAGDMVKSVYDPQGKSTDIFAYVDGKISTIPTPDVSGQIEEHNTSSTAHASIRTQLSNVSRNAADAYSTATNAKALAEQALAQGGAGGSAYTVTLWGYEWESGSDGRYQQTVDVPGVTGEDDQVVVVDVALSGDLDADATMISNFALVASNHAVPGVDTITFKVARVPDYNIQINVGVF